jgi:hypothetical protein
VQYPSTVPLPREAAALIHSAGRPRSSWKGVFAMSAAFASLLAAMMLWLGADPLGSRPDAASSNDPNVAVIAKANWFDSSQRPDSIPTDAVAPKTGAYVLLYVDRQPEKLKSLLEKLDKEFLLTASDTPPIRAQIEDGIWGSVCLLRIPPEELKKMVPAVPYKLVPAKPDADYRWHVNKDVEIALEYVPEKPPAELLEGAELHLVGCYTPGFKKPNKQVNVDVRPTGKPIVLVLTAYYEVHWTVNIHDDADVRAVILSGYFEQKLLSQDLGVPVFIRTYFPVASRHPKYKTARSESCFFAWEQDKQCYPHMKQVLLDMTGKSPVTFQGEYSGDSFLVDGVRGKL